MTHRRKRLRQLIQAAILASLLAVLSPWVIPIGPVGITLATLVIFTVALATPPTVALPAVALYLALGTIGLPVFAGFVGGISAFTSVTGGFLLAYLPATAILSLARRLSSRRAVTVTALILAEIIISVFGCLWYAAISELSLQAAFTVSVLPFLIPDTLKILLALSLSAVIQKRLPASP